MGKPHVHAELIKAWADGAEIEWYNSYQKNWYTSKDPVWDSTEKYRIKPEPVVVEVRYAEASCADKEPCGPYDKHSSDTWWSVRKAGGDNVKATFHDGVLVSVEVIK